MADIDMKASSEELVIKSFYKALADGDMSTVSRFLASDLEWWFHGPPQCQYMMRLLTGKSSQATFRFEPRSVDVVGGRGCVIAEGWEGAKAYWVHVWTVRDGLITQLREYFNTWLMVRDLKQPLPKWEIRQESQTVWQSQPRDLAPRSLPSLLLAI
ncbi:hypothetical protein ACOSP7_029151 [Xanthoceras sorbifolium]|uniref:Wound-induced protein 1 n=1 Tax=Xanthoceras sorbifolium TaxID=99658 RepID=A0ABQ8HBP5_9ROSI|nr:hypothetical protein JRO89_XS12G0078800 [Xanthoceras sorbifolium]